MTDEEKKDLIEDARQWAEENREELDTASHTSQLDLDGNNVEMPSEAEKILKDVQRIHQQYRREIERLVGGTVFLEISLHPEMSDRAEYEEAASELGWVPQFDPFEVPQSYMVGKLLDGITVHIARPKSEGG